MNNYNWSFCDLHANGVKPALSAPNPAYPAPRVGTALPGQQGVRGGVGRLGWNQSSSFSSCRIGFICDFRQITQDSNLVHHGLALR